MFFRGRRVRWIPLSASAARRGLASLVVFAALAPGVALAQSAGCTIVNGGVLNGTYTEGGANGTNTGTTTFTAGETIPYSYSTSAGAIARLIAVIGGTATQVVDDTTAVSSNAPASGSGTYTIVPNTTRLTVQSGSTNADGSVSATPGATVNWTVSCNPAPPTVTSISPAAGPTTGGNSVVITGTGFTGTTGAGGVKFGATNATSYVVNSNTQITATAPAGSAGAVDITVTNGSTSATSAADQYTYLAAPTVSSISPTAGPTAGGTTVTIGGSGFVNGATTVSFGGTAATGVTFNSATSVTVTSPAHAAGTVDVTVTTAGGTSPTSGADQFTYVAAPTVTSISPTSGPGAGGTTVTIGGTGFVVGATTVNFGATAATGVTVNSATSITATSPAGSNTVDVRVTTAGGTSATSGADQFTYIPAPTLTSISPTAGPQTGGTTVTITGNNFTGVTAVTFGATAATGVTFNSATSITATSPAGTGVIDVRVTTPGGTSATSAADQFTYVAAPTATSLTPASGPTAGGTSVTVSGTNFVAGNTTVTIGGATIPAGSVTVNSSTSLTFNTPAHASGNVAVSVTTSGGASGAIPGGFTYEGTPTATSLTPAAGPIAGGTSIAVSGTNFVVGDTSVTIGGTVIPAGSVTVNSATSLTFNSPAHVSGNVAVSVATSGGTSGAIPGGFTYEGAPTATSLTPTSGPTAGGTSVTVSGTNFVAGNTTVTIGGATILTGSVAVNSSTSLTFSAPAHVAGNVAVSVTTAGGTSAAVPGGFTYGDTPTVTSILPNAGPVTGGTTVTLTGTSFTGATAVTFGATAASSITINSATSITATSPAGTGTVDIRVTTPRGTSATLAADQFTYLGAPAVTSIAPASGPLAGGTTVTIAGTGFTGATAVVFGATAATGVTVNSATSITATSPAGTGTVDIRVTTPGGTSAAASADQFTYAGAPAVTSIAPTSGPLAGGTSVTITGTAFTGATAVTFGATAATSFTVNSATQITATSPVGTGAVDIRVTTVGGTSATSAADQFTYFGAPTVTAISPASGPAGGGTPVTISGTIFSGVTAVKFGAATATSFTVNSATSITAVSPAGTGTVDIVVTAAGGTSAASAADRFAFNASTTQTSVVSSLNPSSAGQAVRFTATVSGSSGTPSGTVTFDDGGVAIGTAALAGGVASFTTTSLKTGVHNITAVYGGSGNTFNPSTSAVLTQTVNVPLDSVRLHQLQVNVTKIVAQNSGQAISGAIDDAISEGFADSGLFLTPSPSGFHFNFAADPYEDHSGTENSKPASYGGSTAPFGGTLDSYSSPGANGSGGRATNGRVDDAFAALDRQMPTKALPKKTRDPQDWLFWIDVRGAGLDRLTTTPTAVGLNTTPASLYGMQVNALVGLTRKVTPNFLVGVVAGYENFNFTEQDINGKLTGDGWTVGSYLGWKIASSIRYDLAVAYSGINYNGVSGTAQGNFNGSRWLVQTGFTGDYKAAGFLFEPSANVYALWENEGSYLDSLGTLQPNHDFSTGRASAGAKVAYPFAWSDAVALMPYVGLYSDYYFNQDDAAAILATGGLPLASTPLIQGWSARMTTGLGLKFVSGGMLAFGAEYGGIGSNFSIWTYKAKAQVPF